MGYLVRKVKKLINTSQILQASGLVSPDSFKYFETTNNLVSVFYVDNIDDVYRCLAAINAPTDNGFSKPGAYHYIKGSINQITNLLTKHNASLKQTLGTTCDAIVNEWHYDMKMDSVQIMTDVFNNILFSNDLHLSMENSSTSTGSMIKAYKNLHTTQSRDIEWKMVHKSNIKLLNETAN